MHADSITAALLYDYRAVNIPLHSSLRSRPRPVAALPAPGSQPRSAARPIVARMLPCRLATALLAAAAVSHGRDAPQRPHLVHVVVDE